MLSAMHACNGRLRAEDRGVRETDSPLGLVVDESLTNDPRSHRGCRFDLRPGNRRSRVAHFSPFRAALTVPTPPMPIAS